MPIRTSNTGTELFIVDNQDESSQALHYLREWCDLSKTMDIATGYFEISSLLALDGEWQKVGKIRILMGDEVSLRTKDAFQRALTRTVKILDQSIEEEKRKNDFLLGVPAILEAIRTKKIECKVYRKDKFHAKTYITHAKSEVIGSFALVGSSNFTYSGLTQNLELNVQITPDRVRVLQEWFETYWEEAEDISSEILKVIERHVKEYSPFEVYSKSLYEYFQRHEPTATEWEREHSKIYQILASYQKEGYQSILKRLETFKGAFLCDGVGLGKTFIGLMLIERFVVHEKKNVVLFVPKSGRIPVWEVNLKKYLPHIFGAYSRLEIFNHTDLMRENKEILERLESVTERADVVLIDEAHHFRNTGIRGKDSEERQSRYWNMFDLCKDKQVVFMTATPINNQMIDLQHMIELFSRLDDNYFKEAPLGIHSLTGHIRKLEKSIQGSLHLHGSDVTEINYLEAEDVLSNDPLIRALIVQRSRAYVKKSMAAESGSEVVFPKPRSPIVQGYSIQETYGDLLTMVEKAFQKEEPLFNLSLYYPWKYYKGKVEEVDAFQRGREEQVVRLVRTQFLKRFESSGIAFEMTCRSLLLKLLSWIKVHNDSQSEIKRFDQWVKRHSELIEYLNEKRKQLFIQEVSEDDTEEEPLIPIEIIQSVEKKKISKKDFDLSEIINDTYNDLDQLLEFIKELKDFNASHDAKLQALIKLLKSDKVLKDNKVIIFTEFMDTARYLRKQLEEAGFQDIEEMDSARGIDRTETIKRFSPYYNGSSSGELKKEGLKEIKILISTDVLSEGLNLQDATRLINYDLHWNPVRLMQRIGRVDRRMNPEIERKLIEDHPEQKPLRGDIVYWNFLPPEDIDDLLRLYAKVNHKTLRISKTLGIEGGKLLRETDEFDDLRNFMEQYEGRMTAIEEMRIELNQLLHSMPDLEKKLEEMPFRVFSGKQQISDSAKAVFFCFARPGYDSKESKHEGAETWTLSAGDTHWYYYDLESKKILEDSTQIIQYIRCKPQTPRRCDFSRDTLIEIRKEVEKHINNTYLRKVQAPAGIKPVLRAWMELN